MQRNFVSKGLKLTMAFFMGQVVFIHLSRHFYSLVNVYVHVELQLQCTCTWYSFIKCYLPSLEIAIFCGEIFSQAVDVNRWLRHFEITLLMNKQQAKIVFISTTSAPTYASKNFEERINLNWSECHKEGISFYLQLTTRTLLYFWLVTFCGTQNRFRDTIESTYLFYLILLVQRQFANNNEKLDHLSSVVEHLCQHISSA